MACAIGLTCIHSSSLISLLRGAIKRWLSFYICSTRSFPFAVDNVNYKFPPSSLPRFISTLSDFAKLRHFLREEKNTKALLKRRRKRKIREIRVLTKIRKDLCIRSIFKTRTISSERLEGTRRENSRKEFFFKGKHWRRN